MFCSGCGQVMQAGQAFCPSCGRASASAVPAPGLAYELERYASKVRVLGILWMVYAGLSLVLGFAAMSFARAFFSGGFGPWGMGHPLFPGWFGPALIHFIWLILALRAVVCAIAGWGLLERTPWGRIVAIIAAVLSMLKFPFGTALGVATLVLLLGYRNSTLYDNL